MTKIEEGDRERADKGSVGGANKRTGGSRAQEDVELDSRPI